MIAKIVRKLHPFPIPAFLTRLIDNPIRRKFIQQPDKLAERLHLEPGMKVIEIGPGKGNYTKAIAKQILPGGVVYAVDIQEWVINELEDRIKEENIQNIIPKIDDAYNLSFGDKTIDRFFLNTCLPEIPDPIKALEEFHRVLRMMELSHYANFFLIPIIPLKELKQNGLKKQV